MIAKLGTDIAASWDSGPQCVGPCETLRVQARLAGFSGTLDIYQGESPTALMLTKTSGVLTTETDSDEYYDLRPSEWIRIVVTLSAGTVPEVLVSYSPEMS